MFFVAPYAEALPPTAATLQATMQHGAVRKFTVRNPSFGELVFNLVIDTDSPKHVIVQVRRVGGPAALTVFRVGEPHPFGSCHPVPGELHCGPTQVPAPKVMSTWLVTTTNLGGQADITVREHFHQLSSAG